MAAIWSSARPRPTGQTNGPAHRPAPPRRREKGRHGLADHLAAACPDLTTFVHSTRKTKSAVAAAGRIELVTGPGFIEDRVGRTAFRISPDSFFQTNTAGAERLYDTAMAAAAVPGSQAVWDHYCGSGGIALSPSAHARQVVGGIPLSKHPRRPYLAGENGIVNCEFVKATCADPE
jgi:23S rRNA (uracil1939-C5)-methyltransferase